MQVVGNPSLIQLVVHLFVHLGLGEKQEENNTYSLFVIPSDCYNNIQFCKIQPANLRIIVWVLSKPLLSNPEGPFWKRYLVVFSLHFLLFLYDVPFVFKMKNLIQLEKNVWNIKLQRVKESLLHV